MSTVATAGWRCHARTLLQQRPPKHHCKNIKIHASQFLCFPVTSFFLSLWPCPLTIYLSRFVTTGDLHKSHCSLFTYSLSRAGTEATITREH
jgi:hypothetical protein